MSNNNTQNNHISVPIWLKTTLTIREAAEYSNIGINKIENLITQTSHMIFTYAP